MTFRNITIRSIAIISLSCAASGANSQPVSSIHVTAHPQTESDSRMSALSQQMNALHQSLAPSPRPQAMAAPALGASHIASVNPSQLALAGLPPSTAQQLAQLTATVNSLKLALVQDEQTIQALQQSLTNEELIEWGDKNQMITNLQTVSDNLTQFESATRAGLDEDAMGAMEGFGLACTAVSYTKDSNQQADFKAYTGSEHCGP